MPQLALTPQQLREALDAVQEHGSVTAAALALGMHRETLRARHYQAKIWRAAQNGPAKEFTREELPSELPTAQELIARRVKAFARKSEAKAARRLIPVTVKVDGPIGICHFGDPHVDDDGTDTGKLQAHLDVCNRTEGLFAACVGDYSNNWVGRLARLHAEQSLSAREAWVLVEWLIRATDWLYLVGGNHDCWSGAGDPIDWIARQAGQQYERNGARLGLTLPSGRVFRVNARHEFHGHSQWNTAHGPAKAVQMGARDHVVTCGHRHVSGYQVVKDPQTGLISHAIRVSSYKTFDRYAEEKGLPDGNIFCAPVTILDPRFDDADPRAVTVIFDPHEAAEFLTWKRKRWARGSKAS